METVFLNICDMRWENFHENFSQIFERHWQVYIPDFVISFGKVLNCKIIFRQMEYVLAIRIQAPSLHWFVLPLSTKTAIKDSSHISHILMFSNSKLCMNLANPYKLAAFMHCGFMLSFWKCLSIIAERVSTVTSNCF